MSASEIAKLLLAASISLSIFGISVQIMRLLGTLNATMRDLQGVTHMVTKLLEKVVNDYDKFKNGLENFLRPFNTIQKNVMEPLTQLSAFVGVGISSVKEYVYGEE